MKLFVITWSRDIDECYVMLNVSISNKDEHDKPG